MIKNINNMILRSVLFLTILHAHSQEILKSIETLILPRTANELDTFQLKTQNPKNAIMNMSISCSEDISSIGILYNKYNICGLEFQNEKLVDVNNLLKNIILDFRNLIHIETNSYIKYVFELIVNPKTESIKGKTVQKLKLAEDIPINQLNSQISPKLLEKGFYKVSLLEIDQNYLKNSNVQNFKLNFIEDKFPSGVKTEFIDNILYVIFENREDVLRYSTVDFFIEDIQTQLRSKNIQVVITGTSLLTNRYFSIFIFSVFLISLLLYMIYMLIKIINEPVDIVGGKNKFSRGKENTTADVLTNSIVKWDSSEKDHFNYLKSTQDTTSICEKDQNSIDFCDKSRIIQHSKIKVDDSLMEEIEQFSSMIKDEEIKNGQTDHSILNNIKY